MHVSRTTNVRMETGRADVCIEPSRTTVYSLGQHEPLARKQRVETLVPPKTQEAKGSLRGQESGSLAQI